MCGSRGSRRLSSHLCRGEVGVHRGLTLFALKKYNDSAREFQEALRLDPSFAEAHVRLANIYLRQQNPSKALTEFERYLHDAPKGPFAVRARQVVAEMRASRITAPAAWN